MILCIHLSVYFSGWQFTLWHQLSNGSKKNCWLRFVCFWCWGDRKTTFKLFIKVRLEARSLFYFLNMYLSLGVLFSLLFIPVVWYFFVFLFYWVLCNFTLIKCPQFPPSLVLNYLFPTMSYKKINSYLLPSTRNLIA